MSGLSGKNGPIAKGTVAAVKEQDLEHDPVHLHLTADINVLRLLSTQQKNVTRQNARVNEQ